MGETARSFTFSPEPLLNKLFGFDRPLSRQPLRLPFPGAMGAEGKYGGQQSPIAQMYQRMLQFEEDRAALYRLYDEMELDPTIYAYLETLAEDATLRDPKSGRVAWVESKNADIERICNATMENLGLAHELPQPIIRDFAKYGDDYEFIIAEPGSGIVRLVSYHPATISRVHDEYNRLRGFAPYREENRYDTAPPVREPDNLTKPWDFLHFRRTGKRDRWMYGTSVLYGARRVWRQVQMIEDKLALMRLLRQPSRYKHKIDVTGLSAIDAERKLERYRQRVKRDFRFNPEQQDFASMYTLLAEHEDIFVQTREKDQTDVEILQGLQGVDDIRDFEMFLRRMFGSLRAPPGYFGFEGQANFERSPSQQDLRFSRQVSSLQRMFLVEVGRMLKIDLTYRGIDPLLEENQFTLNMVPPSSLEELYRMEVMESRVRTLDSMLRVGTSLNLQNEAEWLEIVLTEFGAFSRSFTDAIIRSIKDLKGKGETEDLAQKAFSTATVQKALIMEQQNEDRDWKVKSTGLLLPKDVQKQIADDKRTMSERMKVFEKLERSAEQTESEGHPRRDNEAAAAD